MSENEKMLNSFDQYLNQLQQADAMLNKLFAEKNIDELEQKLSLADYAKLNVTCAYALNSYYYYLYFLEYMKIYGIPLDNHKINEEIKRVQEYMSKVQDTLKQNTGEIEENKHQNPIKINMNAASRLIKNSLANDNEQIEKQEKLKDIWEEENYEAIKPQSKDQKEKQTLHNGALMPSTKHLHWKEQIEKMLN